MTNLDSIFKSRDITLSTKVCLGYGFSSGHIWMWELDCEESWVLKNWCFWTVVLEKTFESSLDRKEIQPVHPKGDQSWVFVGRTDVEVETPILWPPDVKSWLIWKDPDAGKDWGQEEKGTTEDEMAGWHHRLDGHGFGWIPGVGDGQGGLACCGSWGRKESDTTERLKWTELNWTHSSIVAWRIPWTENPVGYNPWNRKESDTTEWLTLSRHFTQTFILKLNNLLLGIYAEDTPQTKWKYICTMFKLQHYL